jgi:hypothetical protein
MVTGDLDLADFLQPAALEYHRACADLELAVLRDLLDRASAASVLLDSAQFHAAIAGRADVLPAACLTALIERTLVAHLSDTGAGLTGTGHCLLARAVRAAAGNGQPVEVAFEWTGADRSPEGCLTRYRAARAWWQQTGAGSP